MKEKVLNITGMSCTACAMRIEKALNDEHGVNYAVVNFWKKNVEITYDETLTTIPTLQTAVQAIGYELTEEEGVVE
jgi:Cu+-exporting ATPase